MRRHQLNLLHLHSSHTEIGSHLHNLMGADEIVGVAAELVQSGLKVAAAHALGQVEPQFACAVGAIV